MLFLKSKSTFNSSHFHVFQTHCCIPDMKRFVNEDDFPKLTAFIECQQPNEHLYEFEGCMTIVKDSGEHIVKGLGPEHVLLRGARLKNTAFVYGKLDMLSRRTCKLVCVFVVVGFFFLFMAPAPDLMMGTYNLTSQSNKTKW